MINHCPTHCNECLFLSGMRMYEIMLMWVILEVSVFHSAECHCGFSHMVGVGICVLGSAPG